MKRISGRSENQAFLELVVIFLQIRQWTSAFGFWWNEMTASWTVRPRATGRMKFSSVSSNSEISGHAGLPYNNEWNLTLLSRKDERPTRNSRDWSRTSGTSCSLFVVKIFLNSMDRTVPSSLMKSFGLMGWLVLFIRVRVIIALKAFRKALCSGLFDCFWGALKRELWNGKEDLEDGNLGSILLGLNGYRRFLIQLGSTDDGWKSSMILTRAIPNKVISLILLQGFAAGVVGSSRTT